MIDTSLNILNFLLALVGLFFVPGSLLFLVLFRSGLRKFSIFEFAIFSFALGLSILDFGMLFLSKVGIPISRISLLGLVGIVSVISLSILVHSVKRPKLSLSLPEWIHGLSFSKKESILFIGLIVLTICIKSVYLWDGILPTSTDLGHHMFWAKKIAIEGTVPEYEKINIAFKDESNTLTAPEPIDDFVVGEHLPFAAISLVSGLDVASAFPSLFLLAANILTILTLSILTYHLFSEVFTTATLARRGMILILLCVGPLWALSSPEAKYVSGGVVGNLLGNLLIPAIILALLRAFREKSAAFLMLALLLTGTLAFTHHLSMLIFLYITLSVLIVFVALNRKDAFSKIRDWLALFISPAPILAIIFLVIVILFVYTPTYLDIEAIDTALGSPSKSTREGITFDQLAQSVGGARLGLELVGIALLLLSPLRKTLGASVLLGWSVGLIVMALFPHLVFLDIPSNRIGTYATFPAAILSAYALAALFLQKQKGVESTPLGGSTSILQWSFMLLLIATVTGGFFDNASTLPKESNAKNAVQTFVASRWLAARTAPDEWILKDHNYIVADSWMKLSFMRDYSYPLSRGYLRRYTDEVTLREQCTLLMISAPNTPKGKACFDSTGVDTVVVNPHVDGAQFNKAKEMSLLYISDDIAVYKMAQ